LSLCVQAYEVLSKEGIGARVVSMPCWEQFELQDQAYQDEVLPPDVAARVAVEQAATMGWEKYTGRLGAVVGMHTFGASAPLPALLTKFGFTPEKIVEHAKQQIEKQNSAGMKHAAA
ncbi:MAG: transketolase-like TK C-terminal-containing protein, partial [Janthinobacterium lividum]